MAGDTKASNANAGSSQSLAGRELPNGWRIVKPVERSPEGTGGHFSTCYIVRRGDGTEAFLKATDFEAAYKQDDFVQHLYQQARALLYERALLEKCRGKNLSRVVRLVDGGKLPGAEDPRSAIHYIIFELASSDVRKFIPMLEFAAALRVAHNVATGLMQLHSVDIAHQDLKPSNILLYENMSSAKIGDLGRAVDKNASAPHGKIRWPGDTSYAPPEARYGYIPGNWRDRRISSDYFLLGSLILFMLTKIPLTTMLFKRIPSAFHPDDWNGKYHDVLPYLKRAFASILEDAEAEMRSKLQGISESHQQKILDQITGIFMQLCHLEPEKRGWPVSLPHGSGIQFDLHRYVTQLDWLATTVKIHLSAIARD